jgi:ribosomal protein S20
MEERGQNMMWNIITVYNQKKVIKDGSASIWSYAERLLNESVEKGILRKNQDERRLAKVVVFFKSNGHL